MAGRLLIQREMFIMTRRKIISVILGVLMIAAGIYCFFTPVETSSIIPFVLGIVMIVDGIGRIVTWFDIRGVLRQSAWVLVSAIVSLLFGLMLVFSPALQMTIGVSVILLTGWPYFIYLTNLNRDAVWNFGYYSDNDKQKIQEYIEAMGLQPNHYKTFCTR